MDFSLSGEQRLLVATIRSFIEDELRPLEAGIEETGHLADEVAADIRAKSQALTGYFIELVETRCAGHGLTLISPRNPDARGLQVSFTHAQGGYAIISALIADGVIGDFRAPDVLRFGFTPLYTSFADVWHAVDRMAAILDEHRWDKPEFHARKAVT